MALTKEQFQKARDAGYSTAQIVEFEKKRVPSKASKEEKPSVFPEVTPEEFIKRGFGVPAATALSTAQQLATPAWEYGNMVMGGLPNKALGAMGMRPPEAKPSIATPMGVKDISMPLDIAAKVGGFVRGVPMSAGKAISSTIKGAGIGSAIAKGAVELGTAGALTTPPEESFKNWKSRAMRTGVGAAGGAIIGAGSYKIKSMMDVVKRESQIAKSVRNTLKGKYKQRGADYEGSLYDQTLKSNLKKIDLSKDINSLNRESVSALKAIGKKSDKFSEILRNPKDVSLKQLQDAISEGKNILSKSKLSGRGLTASDTAVNSMIKKVQEIKYREFPEMVGVDKAYSNISENLKVFENSLGKGKTMPAIRAAFNNTEKKEALKELISPELFSQLKSFVNSEKSMKYGAGLIQMFIKYGIIYKTLQSTLGKMNVGGDEVGSVHTMGNH